ncbi:hypothetical protein DRQ50_05660 [bacterium]|nr:MAG: hypothetical protein DRQ50_05660 [bacterium]
MKKILGVIGGMGSVAAVDTMQRLVEMQKAATDQDYIEIVLHNNPLVPDRTAKILGQGPSPLPELLRSVEICNDAGADFILIACMSAHHYVQDMQPMSRAVIIDGVAETVAHIRSTLPAVRRVGVLATTGNLQCELYQRQLVAADLEPVIFAPDEQQELFMDAVYAPWGIKAGYVTGMPRERLVMGAARLVELGAEVVIGGCTEVQVVLDHDDVVVPLVNSVDVLCRVAIESCGGTLR